MRLLILIFLVLFFCSPVSAADVSFSWLPNPESTVTGYKIYQGTESRVYTSSTDVGKPDAVDGRVHATVSDVEAGRTYFAATAYSDEDESDYSTEVSHMIHLGAPLEFTFKATEIKIMIGI